MRAPLLSLAFVAMLLVSSTLANTTLNVNNSAVITPNVAPWFDYVVFIIMENHHVNYTYWNGGPTNSCVGNCTYFTGLANNQSLSLGHESDQIGGSVWDYIALTSGRNNTDPNSSCNDGPTSSTPTKTPCSQITEMNLVDLLESHGLSWKAYMENYPVAQGCPSNLNNFSNDYGPNHNPFLYYQDITNNTTRCNKIVSANAVSVSQPNPCATNSIQTDDVFLADLMPALAPNFMFLTPNFIDDIHDCNDVSVGNAWLSKIVPQILASPLFATTRAALFISFDEPACTFSGCPSHTSGNQVYTVWAGNVKQNYKSVIPYNAFSPLRTVEKNWNLPALDATTDGKAAPMSEFF